MVQYKSVGVLGFAGAGKDTVAEMIRDQMLDQGKIVILERFAAPLKEAALKVFGPDFDKREVKDVQIPVDDYLRWKMVDCLQDCWLKYCQDVYWVDVFQTAGYQMIKDSQQISPRQFQQWMGTEVFRSIRPDVWVRRLKFPKADQVVTDVRFENEIDVVDKLIYVYNPRVNPNLDHKSELLANEILDVLHPKYGIKLRDLRSSSLLEYKGKPMLFVYNNYSLEELNFIIRQFDMFKD